MGIITNTTLVFLTREDLKDSPYKWPILFAVENVMIFLYFIISYGYLPSWFNYIEQIRYGYTLTVLRKDLNDNDLKKTRDNNISNI